MVVLVTCKNKEDSIKKMEELECAKDFPIISLWELSVAMETRVLIRSRPKPYAAFPRPMMLQMKFDFNRPAGLRDIRV